MLFNHVMNSEWDYWHIGMNKPKPELDDGVEVEYWDCNNWNISSQRFTGHTLYRYKRKKYTIPIQA